VAIVAILEDIHGAFLEVPAIQKLRDRAEVRAFDHRLDPPERAEALRDVDIVIGLRERTRFDTDFLRDAPSLRLIVQTGRIGPNVDVDAVNRAGVLIATAGGGSSSTTVELTIGLMIAIMRRIPQSDRAIRDGRWDVPYGRGLRDKTLGIVGMGRIGTQVGEICARGFGMRLLAWSPTMTQERAAKAGGSAASLEELLRASDVVSVHLALNEGTRGLLSADKLALMRPNGYLVNTSRGRVLDEPYLASMLRDGRLAGAALDVYWEEPLPRDHPFVGLDNVVLTPHVGWPADNSYRAFAESAAADIEAFLDGSPINIANPEVAASRSRG